MLLHKIKDLIIYSDDSFYSAFPSIVSLPNGELIVAFRRAPDRRVFSAPCKSHIDPNSYLVLLRSRDLGETWTKDPELIYAHPFGGSQDPCMIQLSDGSLLLTSYAWMLLPEEGKINNRINWDKPYTFLGGYLLRSKDSGKTWEDPVIPPQLKNAVPLYPGLPLPAHNRGAMVESKDGTLFWAVACHTGTFGHSQLYLMTSTDKGLTWKEQGLIASDKRIGFNETSLIQTVSGDIVGFVRTSNYNHRGVIIRSKDKGKTWQPWKDMGIIGLPYHALNLADGRVFLVYGYRKPPFGIRARILDPECNNFESNEIILRDDGGTPDIGYPWACQAIDGRILIAYYFNNKDKTRYIACTSLYLRKT